MGLAAAKRFVQEGMGHVFITGRRKDAPDRAVAEVGRNVTAVQGDVANLTDLDHLYDEVQKQNRRIDVLFANAGVAQLAPLNSVDEKLYDLHFDANVKGMFLTVQKALPLMNDSGAIILTGSIADVKGFPSASVYSATKAAIRSFARTWTNELKDRRIRVNTIGPGHIDTPIFDAWQQGDTLTKRVTWPESSFTSMAASLKSDEEHRCPSKQSLRLSVQNPWQTSHRRFVTP